LDTGAGSGDGEEAATRTLYGRVYASGLDEAEREAADALGGRPRRPRARGPLELARVCRVLRQVAGALDAAHSRGLVHKDVKPGNVLLASGAGPEDEDHVYLTDFGLTKRSSWLTGLTVSGHFLDTIDTSPPSRSPATRSTAARTCTRSAASSTSA
jgi:serine/threonine protein kinase